MPGLICKIGAVAALALTAGFAAAQDNPSDKPFVPSNRWAFVVGVSHYSEEIGPLRYTAKEAREFAAELTDGLRFESDNVRLLADGGLPADAPTAGNILRSLDSLLADKRLDRGNLFVFYFSGHGVATPKGDFLLPADIQMDRVEEMGVPVNSVIQRIVGAGLKNVLFIADACRAGTKNEFGTNLIELCRKANIAVILGCAPGKRSYEYAELKQGAFTHFLLQDLKNPALRDESGVLWASRVGREVQKQVYDYTEPDHGKFAQVPSVWAEQSTLDVLLGAYLRPPISDQAIKTFQTTAGRLDRQQYAAAAFAFADQLAEQDRWDNVAEVLSVVDQLGELTPAGRYLLGISLTILGRFGESERIFKAFETMPDSFYKDLASLTSRSRSISPGIRAKTAIKVFQTGPVWSVKAFAWGQVSRWDPSHEDQVRVAREFAKIPGQTKRQRLYSAGCLAEMEGRWADSADAYRAAAIAPGTFPGDEMLFYARLVPTKMLPDPRAFEKMLDEGLHIEKVALKCYIEKAQLAADRGDAKARIELLRQALARNPEPEQLWTIAEIAGAYFRELKGDITRAASRYPYAWRARMLHAFTSQLEHDSTQVSQDVDAATLYQDDPLTFASTIYELTDSMLADMARLGRVPELAYRGAVSRFFLGLLLQMPQFGYDPDVWMQFTRYGLLNERNAQVAQAVARHIPFQPETAPMALRPMLLFLALNSGDAAKARKLASAKFTPSEGDDPLWMLAAYNATHGREAQAIASIAKLRPPSENLRPRVEAMRTYLLAKTGHRKQARARLRTEVNDLIVRAFDGLAWAALGDWKRAEPLLAEQAKSRNWAFLFVSERAMGVLDNRFRNTGRSKERRALALSAEASQPGNPLFDRYTFAEKPGVAQFAGSVKLSSVLSDDRWDVKAMLANEKKPLALGSVSFTVSPRGELTGTFVDNEGGKLAFQGRVDELGNVKGQANWRGRKCTLAAKIAPPTLYKSYAGFKELGQLFHFLDDQGYRVVMVCRPQ